MFDTASSPTTLRVLLLAGGVGGAKLAEGLAALDGISLKIIGNIADDDEFHGLWVSPDIDTLTYSLAGVIDRGQGWGCRDDAHRALQVLGTLGAETWMSLGDRDFGLHIWRSHRRRLGHRPFDIARDAARAFGVTPDILLPTDDIVQTRIKTQDGWHSFQQYFVQQRHAPAITAIDYLGADRARPTPEALAAFAWAELIVIAPSNPLVSIKPILAIPGITQALRASSARKIAVSPFIAGGVVKGPADKMMQAMGLSADAAGLLACYGGLIDDLVVHQGDQAQSILPNAASSAVAIHARDIWMPDLAAKVQLAEEIVAMAAQGARVAR